MLEAIASVNLSQLLWPDVSLVEIFIRGTIVYLALFLLMRGLRRPTGQLGIADVLLITVLADAAQNAMSGGPSSKMENAKSGIARTAAGITPISERSIESAINPIANSTGRSGLTNRLARLRDHISSSRDNVMPNWPRTSTSHSRTAPISTPAACTTHDE